MQSSFYANSSRPAGPYSGSELNSLLTKGVVSPAIVLWMLGPSSRKVSRDDETRRPQNWKIAALAMTIICGGILIAGMLPSGSKSEAAIGINNTQETQDHKLPQITQKAIPDFNRSKVRVAEWSTPASAGLDPTFLSAQAARAARPTLSPRRQLAVEYRRSIAYSHPLSLFIKAAAAARPTLSPQRALVLEYRRSIGDSTPQQQPMRDPGRSIAYSDAIESYKHYLDSYSSGTFVDIATESITELPPISRQEVNRSRDGTAKKIASTSSSKIPGPKKLAKTRPVKLSTKKVDGRCWKQNIRWWCRKRCSEGDAQACQKLKRLGG
jgi:hypothetical protein